MDAAAARGLPLMVEKPLAVGLPDSAVLIHAASRIRAPFLVNHLHLFSPAYEALRDEVLGRPSGIRVRTEGCGLGPYRPYSSLWDYGPHDASMLFGIGLDPRSCSGTVSVSPDGTLYSLDVSYRHGWSSSSVVGNGSRTKRRLFEARFGSRTAVYDDTSPDKLVADGVAVPICPDLPLDRSVRAFLTAAKTGTTDWRFGLPAPAWIASFLDLADRSVTR